MQVALGRLHVDVTLAPTRQDTQPRRQEGAQKRVQYAKVERAYRRARLERAIAADRARWESRSRCP